MAPCENATLLVDRAIAPRAMAFSVSLMVEKNPSLLGSKGTFQKTWEWLIAINWTLAVDERNAKCAGKDYKGFSLG